MTILKRCNVIMLDENVRHMMGFVLDGFFFIEIELCCIMGMSINEECVFKREENGFVFV